VLISGETVRFRGKTTQSFLKPLVQTK